MDKICDVYVMNTTMMILNAIFQNSTVAFLIKKDSHTENRISAHCSTTRYYMYNVK